MTIFFVLLYLCGSIGFPFLIMHWDLKYPTENDNGSASIFGALVFTFLCWPLAVPLLALALLAEHHDQKVKDNYYKLKR